MTNYLLFFNRCFDKKRLKNFILWFFNKYGERETIKLIEDLKKIGFQHATNAGISIGIDDLKIPFVKSNRINLTEQNIKRAEINYQKGNITEIERQQQFVDEWNFISEKLKRHVIQFFKATDIFNPIYMMAFSGARGNISQIRQLIGMRGLMADPQGQILDFPIRSSFREGLTLTEYLISCYGARKGVVDTALRTATSGYLTRRLVDVTQQVVIGRQNCNTSRGVQFTNLIDGTKILLPLKDRLIGRVLCDDLLIINPLTKKKSKIGFKNQEISTRLAKKIYDSNYSPFIRSPLTCSSKNSICQLCYGWNLAYNSIVSIGEAVGVLAAQSIGEPGTQLTMRTFHTGGVFTGGLIDQIYSPFHGEVNYINNFNGVLVRTLKGRIGFLTKTDGTLQVRTKYTNNLNIKSSNTTPELVNLFFSNQFRKSLFTRKKSYSFLIKEILKIEKNLKAIKNFFHPSLTFNIPRHAILFRQHGSLVREKELIAELSSIAISDNRRQETEQDVFAPINGQVFFEKLILIEKTKRDGSIQKTTYGLGSLWIISAHEWNSLISPHIFPTHGDLISSSSIVQRLKILNKKSCYFDQSILDSFYALERFKSRSFLTKQSKNIHLKTKYFNNILINQTFYSNNFQQIYYKSFRYFLLIKYQNTFLNNWFYSKKNNLSIREYISKKNRVKIELKYLLLGLNFRFYQNNIKSRIQKQKPKINFLLHSIQNNINLNKKLYFFSLIKFKSLVQPKLKNIVISRKTIKYTTDFLNKFRYQYWYEIYSFYFNSILVLSNWVFYKKKSPKNFDFIFLKRNYGLYKLVSKLKKIIVQPKTTNIFNINEYNISKFFLINFKTWNFTLYFDSSATFEKYSWISTQQSNFILTNRQGYINFQLSKLWCLSKRNTFQNFSNYISSYGIEKRIFSYNFNFFIDQIYTINIKIKPILINPILFLELYNNNKKTHINYYLIQKFLLAFYYEYLLNLKIDNYFFNKIKKDYNKIGFQTHVKISTIPVFLTGETGNNKNILQLKKVFFKDEKFTFLKKLNLYKKNLKKQLSSLDWPCTTYKSKTCMDEFGYCLNFGLGFKQNIYFDRHQIVLDIVYNQNFYKFDLLNSFSDQNFHRLKIRFLAHRLLSKNLIVFQKIQKCVNWRDYYSKTLNLTNNYKNYEYHNALIFNFTKNYFTNFEKSIINKNKSFQLFSLDHSIKVLHRKKIFFKINFIQTLYNKTKTLFNLEYPVLLKTYPPILQKRTKRFKFNNNSRSLENKDFNYLVFNNLIYFSSKFFCLNSIQKLNFQIILNSKHNNIQILYKNFKYCSIINPIYIHFSECLQDGEVIYTNSKKCELEKKFTILTQSNLKSFQLDCLTQEKNPNNLTLSNFLRYGTILENQKIISTGGQVISIDRKSFTIRKAIPFLITSKSLLNVHQNALVKKGSRLFTFLSYQLKTGDIIQGIPKIEEFFEARLTRDGLPLLTNLHTQIKQLFQTYKANFSVFEATQKSFEKIQYLIINEIQKVYCTQGIYIADKHLEIVVRQMTTKVQVIKGGNTGLLCGELIELDWIRSIEQKFSREEISYEPIILGITKSCLETESFISAASFQETTRILTKAAIQNKIDFIRGLKQNVILGNLVPAGTGFFSPLYIKYSNFD